MNFLSDFIVLDIAPKNTGYLVSKDTEVLETGVIKGEKIETSWIPVGEGRSEKELYKKSKGKVTKKRDSRRRDDILHNRLIYKSRVLKKLILKYRPIYIIKEMPIMARDNRTALDLGQSHGIINTLEIPIIVYYPMQWRSSIKKLCDEKDPVFKSKENIRLYKRITREKNKKPFVNLFYRKFGRLPVTNDESDAYAIFLHHMYYDQSMFSYINIKKYWEEFEQTYDYEWYGEQS